MRLPPRGPRNTYFWRVSSQVWHSFLELVDRLEDPSLEDDEILAIRENIRALPGHPLNTDDCDLIIPILTSTTAQVPTMAAPKVIQ